MQYDDKLYYSYVNSCGIQKCERRVIIKDSRKRLLQLSLRTGDPHSLYMYTYRYCKFDRGTMPCFSTPLSNPDNKVPLNLAYHCTNILRLRSTVLSRYLRRRCPFVVDPITGRRERVLRNKRTVRLSWPELVYAVYAALYSESLSEVN